MPIISIRDHESNIWKRSAEKKQKQERTRGDRSYSKRVRAKWFCYLFILGFLQLLYKASLVFKSNLELALSVILKQRELYESKHVGLKYRCLKIWDLFVVTKTSNDHKWQHTTNIRPQTINKRTLTTRKRPQRAIPTHQTKNLTFRFFFPHPVIARNTLFHSLQCQISGGRGFQIVRQGDRVLNLRGVQQKYINISNNCFFMFQTLGEYIMNIPSSTTKQVLASVKTVLANTIL